MKIIDTVTDMIAWQRETKKTFPQDTIGFVPTMGALHNGHLDIVKHSQNDNQKTVVSIFVNPTQFNDPMDFEKYPKTIARDISRLEPLKVDVLFLPRAEDIYSDGKNFSIEEQHLKDQFCEARRQGHFQGVMTVVMKLLNIVSPHKIYLGEKDFQQLQIIRDMVNAFFMPVEVCGVPTVRDNEGLALSSRNERLSADGLRRARIFAKALRSAQSEKEFAQELEKENIRLDYLDEYKNRRLAAVYIDNIRLIDNVEI